MFEVSTPVADRIREFDAARQPSPFREQIAMARRLKVETGLPDLAEVGSRFPDGDLLTVHGEPTTFLKVAAGRPAVVVFYRGAWCPYCNIALRAYDSELAGPLEAANVSLLAISSQKPDGSMATSENALSFTVLSDTGNHFGRELGILNVATESELATHKAIGFDLTKVNADGTSDLVMPTTAVVDADGVLRFLDVHIDFTTRTEPSAILAAVSELGIGLPVSG